MIKAVVTLNDNSTIDVEVSSNDFNELFRRLEGFDMKYLDARVVSPSTLRQGKRN